MSGVEVLKTLRFAAQDSRQVEEEEDVPVLAEPVLVYREFCTTVVTQTTFGTHVCGRHCEIGTALVAFKEEYYIVSAAGLQVEKWEQTREAAGRSYERRIWVTRSPGWKGKGLYAGVPQGGRVQRREQDGRWKILIEGYRRGFPLSLNVHPKA